MPIGCESFSAIEMIMSLSALKKNNDNIANVELRKLITTDITLKCRNHKQFSFLIAWAEDGDRQYSANSGGPLSPGLRY